MYFSVIALLAAAASASALPFNLIQSRQAPSCDVLSGYSTVPWSHVNSANDTHSIECAVAVGPTAASCTAAAVQGGSSKCCCLASVLLFYLLSCATDAFSDVGCLAGSVNLIVNHVSDYLPRPNYAKRKNHTAPSLCWMRRGSCEQR